MKSKEGKGEGGDRRGEQSPGAPREDEVPGEQDPGAPREGEVPGQHSADDAGKDEMDGERRPHEPDEDKVIRLPRDWLGPREDLVPFGPSADRQEPLGSEPPLGQRDRPDDASARPPLEEVAPLSPEPVSPDDFWGERSAALQGPLDEADRDGVVADKSAPTRRLRRGRVVAATAAALAAVALVSVSLLGQSSSGPGRSRVSAGIESGGGGTVDSGGGRGTLWPLPAHAPVAVHGPGRSGHGRSRSGHGRSKSKRSTLPHRSASLAVNYVRQPASTQGGAGGGSSASSGTGSYSAPASASNPSPTTVSVPTSSSGTTATNSGATSAATTTSSTTPTSANGGSRHKAPAFGAGGALGPGHSGTG